jgi:predicted transposase YdaD
LWINFDEKLINVYLKEELMRESVVYQRIVAECRQKALQEGQELGLNKGLQLGEQKGEANLVLRQLSRRFGILPQGMTEQIRRLGTIQLESLGEALLDFTQLSEVEAWLAGNS